ncbi:MAG: hypothetical protein ACRD0K_29550 [Egibacteraceae bacterium]
MSRIQRALLEESRKARGLIDLDVGGPVAAVAGPPCGRGLVNCLGRTLAACALCGRGHAVGQVPIREPGPDYL